MSNKTASGLVAYCKAQVGKPYWFGTFGQTATEALYKQKKAQYPGYYTASDFVKQLGQRVHDCCGLIKGYLWSDTPTSLPAYDSSQDTNVAGFYKRCTKCGAISTLPETPGVLVFMANMQHVGVYIGEGWVIEARGHAYGVVKTKLSDRGWGFWGMSRWIDYSEADKPAAKTIDEIAKEVIAGKWGAGSDRKTKLTNAGYDYATVQAKVNELMKSSTTSYKTYTVKSGDSLWTIASKQLGNGNRYKEIKSLNGLSSDVIKTGQVLKLPSK